MRRIYQVVDTRVPLLAVIPMFMGENSRDALHQYLAGKGLGRVEFIRRGDNFVQWSVQEVIFIDGVKYRRGKQVWYGEVNDESFGVHGLR